MNIKIMHFLYDKKLLVLRIKQYLSNVG